MNLTSYISERLKTKKVLLMTHAVVGCPSLEANWTMLEMMQKAGVDLVELQFPFSEPSADGPVFVKANQVALENGIQRQDYFDFLKKASETFDFPLIMMSYYNPIFMMGNQEACQRLKDHGGSGFIIPDLPIDEYGELSQELEKCGLDSIRLCSPTNTDQRLHEIFEGATGFVYCVARKGVTGTKTELNQSVDAFIARCRAESDVPLALGFGLSKPEDIQALHGKVEIAIIGSAMLKLWENQGETAFQEHLHQLVASCH